MVSGANTLPGMINSSQINPFLNGMANNPYQTQATNAIGNLYSAYSSAYNALAPSETAALTQFNTQSGQMKSQAAGGLNARGLTNSLLGTKLQGSSSPISGYGSGALTQLAAQRMSQQNNLQQGYVNQANQLNNNFLSNAGNIASTYGSLGNEQQRLTAQNQAQQPNIFGVLGLATKAIPFM